MYLLGVFPSKAVLLKMYINFVEKEKGFLNLTTFQLYPS